MGVKVRIKNSKLYLDIYQKGRRKWEALYLTLGEDKGMNREALRLAEIARAKKEQQLFSHEWNLLDPVRSKQSLEDYARKSAATKPKSHHLPKALPYLEEYAKGIRLEAVNEEWLEGFKAYLFSTKKIKTVTISHYFAAVCSLLKQAHRDRIIPRNPAENVKKVSEPEALKVWLTPEEIERLARTPAQSEWGDAVKRGFLFSCLTGLRVSDIKTLAWGDIIRSPAPMVMKRQVKTQGIAGIPLNPSAWAIIKADKTHPPEELIFPTLSKSKASTSYHFRLWPQRAGIQKKIGWHTARHSFAVLSLEGGADLYTVSKLLGHTDIQTTQAYAKATDGMKRKAVNALPEINLDKRGEIVPMPKVEGAEQ
jgi:integrase